jgi:hypothetical protein
MKVRFILIAYAVVSVLGLMLLLSRENLYTVLALLIGFMLLGHRELWSLIRYRRMPVIDERVRANLTGAVRATGVFFGIAGVVLILLLHFDVFENVPAGLLISCLLVAVGLVYVISYHYYDRVCPGMGERAARWFRICLAAAGLSLSTIALAIVLHNLAGAWFGFEEAFFFILGVLVAPAVMVVSLLGGLGIYLRGLFASSGRGEN